MNVNITDIARKRARGGSELLRESDLHMRVDRVSERAFQPELKRANFIDADKVPSRSETASPTEAFAEFQPTHEQICSRAQERYEARMLCGIVGDAMSDWLAAECELLAGVNGS